MSDTHKLEGHGDYAMVRRKLLRIAIVFLSLTALIAMGSVLFGDFGDFEIRVLLTTLTISVASACAMACAAYVDRRDHRNAGLAGMALALISGVTVLIGVWFEPETEFYFKTVGILCTVTIAVAHALFLAGIDLDRQHVWARRVAVVCIAFLAFIIVMAILTEATEEFFYRGMGVVAIAVALFSVVVPILSRLRKSKDAKGPNPYAEPMDRLVLTRDADGAYRDASGARYVVRPADDV